MDRPVVHEERVVLPDVHQDGRRAAGELVALGQHAVFDPAGSLLLERSEALGHLRRVRGVGELANTGDAAAGAEEVRVAGREVQGPVAAHAGPADAAGGWLGDSAVAAIDLRQQVAGEPRLQLPLGGVDRISRGVHVPRAALPVGEDQDQAETVGQALGWAIELDAGFVEALARAAEAVEQVHSAEARRRLVQVVLGQHHHGFGGALGREARDGQLDDLHTRVAVQRSRSHGQERHRRTRLDARATGKHHARQGQNDSSSQLQGACSMTACSFPSPASCRLPVPPTVVIIRACPAG